MVLCNWLLSGLLPRKYRFQSHTLVCFQLDNAFGRIGRHHLAAGFATFWAEVHDPIGFGEQVQIVLDSHHAVTAKPVKAPSGRIALAVVTRWAGAADPYRTT